MKKFKNSFDVVLEESHFEKNDQPSMTQPNMTMSLEEILKRYTRGGEVATFTPVYQDGDDFDDNPDISKMDTVERKEYARELRQSIKDYQKRQKSPPKEEENKPVPDPKAEPAKVSEDDGEAGKQ